MEWDDLRLSEIFVLPGKAMYVKANPVSVRHFWENMFSKFAHNDFADKLASYYGKQHGFNVHRFYDGHDLLIDVPKTFKEHGLKEAIKQTGHIVLTDFPTKGGIPIPGFSNTGLGKILVEHGIAVKSLLWNLTDVVNLGCGLLCIGEGATDLISAFSGKMEMNFTTFCDTFGEGAFQLAFGIPTGNGLAIAAGIENIFAGIVSAWKTYTIQIDLVPFFGATLTSTLLGFLTAKYLCKNEMPEVIQKSVKSGMITALFQLSASFGYGAAACCAYIDYVKYLAQKDSKEVAKVMKVDKNCYENFLKVLNSFEDKELRDTYLDYDTEITNEIVTSLEDYDSLIGEDMDLAMSVLNSNRDSEVKKLMQGDFLVNYLEKF